MSNSIEWAHADNRFYLVEGDEDAGDGNTPNGELDGGPENIAQEVEGCALYGQPAELLELLSDGIAKVSAHLAGQQ
jgi:hypothetical protein